MFLFGFPPPSQKETPKSGKEIHNYYQSTPKMMTKFVYTTSYSPILSICQGHAWCLTASSRSGQKATLARRRRASRDAVSFDVGFYG